MVRGKRGQFTTFERMDTRTLIQYMLWGKPHKRSQ